MGGGSGAAGAATTSATVLAVEYPSVQVNVAIGHQGAGGGTGGATSAYNLGAITTSGQQAAAIDALSIGGGGVFFVEGNSTPSASSGAGGTASGASFLNFSASSGLYLGGNGGGGGSGSNVSVADSGDILAIGNASFGILAQSVGGGGGLGGSTDLNIFDQITTAFGVFAPQVWGGSNGNGGTVTINLNQQPVFATLGDGSVGIVAQSVGGGYGGLSNGMSVAVGGNASTNGNGGAVNVQSQAGSEIAIVTLGQQADGMYLQSLGGGGGLMTNAIGPVVVPEDNTASRTAGSGAGGPITVQGAGTILTLGNNASAIIAQSGVQKADGSLDPSRQGGNISINWTGTLQGGTGTGVGVLIDGGANNTLTLNANSTLSAASGNAIQATFGNDTVNDAGTITGNVNLDGGRPTEINAFNIQSGGTFNSAASVALGALGTLTNAGQLNVAGQGTIGTTKLTGSYVNAGGTLGVDTNFATMQADLLSASGSAKLDTGQVAVNLLGLPPTFNVNNMPALPIVTAQSVSIGNNMTVNPTVVLTYNLATAGGNAATVQIAKADFMPPAVAQLPNITDNMRSVAAALQNAWDQGKLGEDAAGFAALANVTSPTTYAQVLSDSDDGQEAVPASTILYNALRFQNTLHSCPVFVEDTTLLNEQDCVYLRSVADASNMPGTAGNSGYHGSGYAIELGGEKQFAPGWFIGGAIAPGQSWSSDTANTSSASSNTLDAGLVVKHFVTSQLLLAGSLSYGNESTTLSHYISDPVYGTLSSQAQQELNRVTGRVRAEYDIPLHSWYIRPMMDLDLTYTHMTPYTETGSGFLDTHYDATDKAVPDFSPTIEFGKRLNYRNLVARLYTDIGMTWFVDPTWQQEGNYTDLPDANFYTYSNAPPLVGRVTAGAQLVAWRNLSFEAEYDGTYSPAYVDNMGTLRVDWRF